MCKYECFLLVSNELKLLESGRKMRTKSAVNRRKVRKIRQNNICTL